MEDQVGPSGDQRRRDTWRAEIGGKRFDLAHKFWRFSRNDICQRQPLDRSSADTPGGNERLSELAADHSSRADDENMHVRTRGLARPIEVSSLPASSQIG